MQSISPAFIAAIAASTPRNGDKRRFRCGALGSPERRGIGDAADTHAGGIGVLDLRELGSGRHQNFLRSSSTGMKVTSHLSLATEFWISPEARCGTNSTGTPSFRAIAEPRSTVTPRNFSVVPSLTA